MLRDAADSIAIKAAKLHNCAAGVAVCGWYNYIARVAPWKVKHPDAIHGR